MPDNYGKDTEKLIHIMTLAIVITVVFVILSGTALLILNLIDNHSTNNQETIDGIDNAENNVVTDLYDTFLKGNTILQDIFNDDLSAKTLDSAKVIEPYTPDDPAYILAASMSSSVKNPIPSESRDLEYWNVLYDKKQTLSYTPVSILVDVYKGPLCIYYEIDNVKITSSDGIGSGKNRKYTEESAEIKGIPTEVPYYSFFEIEVLNASDNEIIAKKGFGRTYSSESNQSISVYSTGTYRVNFYGSGLDASLLIVSGADKNITDAIGVDPLAKNKFAEIRAQLTKSSANIANTKDDEYSEWW